MELGNPIDGVRADYRKVGHADDAVVEHRHTAHLTAVQAQVVHLGAEAAVNLLDDLIVSCLLYTSDSIRECARPSKGVRVMRIGEDNKVVTLARAPHEEEDDGEELEGLENTEGGEEEIPDSAGAEEAQTPEE